MAEEGCQTSVADYLRIGRTHVVNVCLKVSNRGGTKLSTCQYLGLKSMANVDDRCGGVPHVARFIQQRIEHQSDRQTD